MGTSKRGSEEERTLLQNGSGTYIVSLPISAVRQLKWRQGQKLVVKKSGNKLIIEDWKK